MKRLCEDMDTGHMLHIIVIFKWNAPSSKTMRDVTNYQLPRSINSDGTDDNSKAFDLQVNEAIMKNKCFTRK